MRRVALTDSFQWQRHFFRSDGQLKRIDEMDTVYVWGANLNNVDRRHGAKLHGGGMASERGPTRGRAHGNYIGVVSILYPEHGDTLGLAMCSIEKSFRRLHRKLKQGYRIEFPAHDASDATARTDVAAGHGLGKGIAASKQMTPDERADYVAMQNYIRRKITALVRAAE